MATPSNGTLSTLGAVAPVEHFVPIEAHASVNAGSNLLLTEAARQLGYLQSAFQSHFGKPLNISEAFRSFASQVTMKILQAAGGALAATPGTSVHGWALAVDFGSGVATFGSAEKVWMDANAPKYGWHPTGNGFSRPEAWHFEYKYGTATISTATASTGTEPLVPVAPFTDSTLIGDDMFAAQIVTASKRGPVPAGAKFILDIRGKVIKRVDTAAKLTAAQKKTLQDEWNTLVAVQPNKEPIHWSGDDAWAYYDGGYKRLYW